MKKIMKLFDNQGLKLYLIHLIHWNLQNFDSSSACNERKNVHRKFYPLALFKDNFLGVRDRVFLVC